ncbi:M48 family metalloprotease [Aurantiacibacter poecillastricola]|uniref:M48 family metalloprotease n=1 Tax=Aurantiacibacter poecillastricola TaxID=3064385 RepID=UPI00273D3A50|nr:M48 family metalloprotease [Aurantiacibacter sp. 219JJ12-13]MDP5262221.1 M48 family metalloprotease [Aurantiacibacter sp. 219JJ12-13]
MPLKNIRKMTAAALAGAASLALGACASIPGANVAPGSPITAEEAQLGAENHEAFVQQFGGAMTGPYARYVDQVGSNIAVQSGLATRPDAFEVTLLNSSVNNAFAVPGGYVYATRQLVNLMNNEAELAAVLGHEVGHVAARHSARRQQAAQRNQLLGLLGAVLGSAVLNSPDLAQLSLQGSQLATLSYSRSQELEADQLGIQYLNRAGYDPTAMATLLASLAAQNQLDAQLQGRGDATIPEWASTHPDPASRVQNARQLAGNATGVVNRETFLSRIDGMIYGDDPEQGVIEGRQFIHPLLRFSFTAPQGFYMVNGTSAVTINGDQGRAQLTLAPYNNDLNAYVRGVFNALGGEQQQLNPRSIERTTVNGLPAAYGTATVSNGQQQVDVTVFAYEFDNDTAYHFSALTPAGQSGVFNTLYQSMRRISAQEAGDVTPRRIDVVTAGRGDTVRTMANRMAYDNGQEARFRVLNGLGSNEQLVPGRQYKIVIRAN